MRRVGRGLKTVYWLTQPLATRPPWEDIKADPGDVLSTLYASFCRTIAPFEIWAQQNAPTIQGGKA